MMQIIIFFNLNYFQAV